MPNSQPDNAHGLTALLVPIAELGGEQIGAYGGWITAGAGALVLLLNAFRKNHRQDKRIEFTEQGSIIDRQEKRIAVLEALVTEQQGVINRLQELNAKCREESAATRAYLLASKAILARHGIHLPAPPDMGEDTGEGDFLQRTLQQSALLAASPVPPATNRPPAPGGPSP